MNQIKTTTQALNEESLLQLKAAYKAIDEKFGSDTMVLDISEISTMADFFIITNGGNANQLKAIADAVEEELFKTGLPIKHSEGYASANWVLLDFGDIIVHVFDKESRSFYNLERVWGDAKTVDSELLM